MTDETIVAEAELEEGTEIEEELELEDEEDVD